MKKIFKEILAFFNKDKWSSEGIFALFFAAVLVFNIMLTIVVEAFGLYLSPKDTNDYSISGNTDHLFDEAIKEEKKIKISFCLDKDGIEKHASGQLVHATVKEFQERYPTLVEIDYINVLTRRNKDGKLVDLGKYQKDMRGNETKVLKTSVIFECGENYRVITDRSTSAGFADFYTLSSSNQLTSYNGEEVVAAMMSWVLSYDAENPKVAFFTQYHGETSDPSFANLLACAGYYVDVLDLKTIDNVPDEAAMVVISNPRADFERGAEGSGIDSEIEKLRAYLDRGGNLLVTLDPYVKKLEVLEGFIAEYGISLASTSEDAARPLRKIVKDYSGSVMLDGFTLVAEYADSELAKEISGRVSEYSDGGVIIREASALELFGNAKPLLTSSGASVLEANGKTLDRSGSYAIAAYSDKTYDNGKTSRLLVIQSVYIAASDALVSREYSNKDFIYAIFEKYFGSGVAPYGCNDVLFETSTLENLTMRKARIYTALIMAVPVALAVTGAVIIVKRRQR